MKTSISYIIAAVLLVSCTEKIGKDECSTPISLMAVTMSGETIETKAATAAEPYTLTSPNSDNPIDADIWFSTTAGTYTGTGTAANLNVHTTINYTSGAYTFPSLVDGEQLKYPAGGSLVYCVGFFPRTINDAAVWTVSADGLTANSVAGLVDGKTDILYAPQISGSTQKAFDPQCFDHILTWIKVRVRVSSSDAPVTWGKLQKIEVLTKDQAAITLGTGAVTFSNSSGSADKVITAYENSSGLTLPTVSTEVGSVFINSLSGTADSPAQVTFQITTEEWGGDKDSNTSKSAKTVTVDLMDKNQSKIIESTAGKLYVVTLSFDSLKTIDASATLTPWVEENRDLTGSVTTNNS